ncbi:MAG: hypothetical protein ACR2NT_03015 [Acidimicrobiia bacterium]
MTSALSQRGSVVTKAGTVVVGAGVVDTTVVPSEVVATDGAVVDPGKELVVSVGDEHEETKTENDTRAAVNLARSTQRVLTPTMVTPAPVSDIGMRGRSNHGDHVRQHR